MNTKTNKKKKRKNYLTYSRVLMAKAPPFTVCQIGQADILLCSFSKAIVCHIG